jgi:tetratricopeptide (TPR) repeat protein
MDEQDNPVVKFISQVSKQIFERTIRGQIDYDNDIKALQKYREMAQKANAPRQEANMVNYMAVLNSVSGHLTLADEQFTQLFILQQANNSLNGMVTALNNRAVFLSSLGKYEEASGFYLQAIALAEGAVDETLVTYARTLGGKLSVGYMLPQYDDMLALFDKISGLQDRLLSQNPQEYARIMTDVNRSMAEYHLHHKDYTQAQAFIRTGIDFATGLGLTFELADLYYTQAHIALAHGDTNGAEAHWSKAVELLKNVPAKSTVGRNYNQEARYLEQHGYTQHGQRFAKYAYDIFASLNMDEDAKLAQVLL